MPALSLMLLKTISIAWMMRSWGLDLAVHDQLVFGFPAFSDIHVVPALPRPLYQPPCTRPLSRWLDLARCRRVARKSAPGCREILRVGISAEIHLCALAPEPAVYYRGTHRIRESNVCGIFFCFLANKSSRSWQLRLQGQMANVPGAVSMGAAIMTAGSGAKRRWISALMPTRKISRHPGADLRATRRHLARSSRPAERLVQRLVQRPRKSGTTWISGKAGKPNTS